MVPQTLRVLVIDDDEDDIFLTSDYLNSIDTFKVVIDKEINFNRGREKILKNEHDVCLVDYLLGSHTGLELIKECVAAGIQKPFILMTGKGDRNIDIEATKAGAYDYLTKSELNAELLERSLRYSMQRYMQYETIVDSEKRFREIFLKSNDIIFVLDKDFRFVNFNPMMTALMGYTAQELLQKPITTLFEKEEDGAKYIDLISSNPSTNSIEIALCTKDKNRKTFLASCSKLNMPDGIGVYQGILYDYTSMKKSVEEQMLRDKIETTTRLVRSLAHEIRNPLTNINLSVHQLEGEINDDKKLFTDIIKRNSKRINDLIGELMHLSTPAEKGEEIIDLTKLVKDTLSTAKDRMALKGVKVSEKLASGDMFVKGDAKKIQMALLNIVINAIEAMEEGKGELEVETLKNGTKASIKIKDNGSGISKENMEHLFQPFFTGKKNGIGLGLATTLSFIQAHQGAIEVDSTVGIGSVFTVKLNTITP